MSRRVFPRSDALHGVVAREVLERHAQLTRTAAELPIPIEQIVEVTYQLEVLWDELLEPPGVMILGALFPADRRIVLNERHASMFEGWVGPERFTLAHELAHWIYDADDPDQLTLDFAQERADQFCYHRTGGSLADDLRLREVNANKLASHLLLPEHLVREADVETVLADFRRTAAAWGVSQQTLRIQLETLGMIDAGDVKELRLL